MILFSCNENSVEKKMDPKVVAAVVEGAMKTADRLDGMNMKAYEMGQVGTAMAENGAAGAAEVLDGALKTADEVHSLSNKAVAEKLRTQTADWSAKDLEQITPTIDRIEKATARVWVIRSIAEGIGILDKGKAMIVLSDAARDAGQMTDMKYRDMDLRSVSAAMAPINLEAAVEAAGRISDPRVKAWALTEAGKEASEPAAAVKILAMAGDAALAIQQSEPESELLCDRTPASARDKVLSAEKSRLVAASAKALAGAALAMNKVDAQKARAMFGTAVETAASIEHPYTKAYAMSDVAMVMAEADPAQASQLSEQIEPGHEDAKFAAMMKVASVNAKNKGRADEAEIDKVAEVAKSISDPYDRAKALQAACTAMVPVNKDKAAQLAADIDYPELRNTVLAAVAVEYSKQDDGLAKKALDNIAEPRFAKAAVLYVKAGALSEMAAIKAQKDQAAAIKLYGKAAGAAAEAKSQALQWKIATALCALDQNKLFDMAAKIDSDDSARAVALSDIAADWSSRGDQRAGMVWDLAAKAAGS
ncbi:MAG: hypothetical protein ABSG42_01145, partial [Nitrospirota bacterium]